MQAKYPDKLRRVIWEPVNVEYPVRKFPETGVSSETIARQWRPSPPGNILKHPEDVLKEYTRHYNITKELNRSQTTLDFGFKHPETERFNKHTPLAENNYIYPPSRRLADRPPMCGVRGSTEMRSSYTYPTVSGRLVTDKDQFTHPEIASMSLDSVQPAEPLWLKELEPLDTTYEGFEKHLDPYLTTSRLHHRPYTADQLSRPSVTKDIVTYYTCADVPWVRSPKPDTSNWRLVNSRPNSCDREVFKQNVREIRTHNKLNWVPGSFRTEARDNYVPKRPKPNLQKLEDQVKSFYSRSIVRLPTQIPEEDLIIRKSYFTENAHVGSGKPLCSVINQHVEKNKRLERQSMQIA